MTLNDMINFDDITNGNGLIVNIKKEKKKTKYLFL